MKQFDIEIAGGKRGILLHNPAGQMGQKGVRKSSEGSVPTPEAEAAAGLYWMPDKSSISFPADNLHSALIAASSGMKIKRLSLAPFISGSIEIAPDDIPFHTKKYEVDIRRAVVQRQGILRARPLLSPWKLNFSILVEDDFPVLDVENTLRALLEIAGGRIGIGDYRPQRRGRFGKFKVVSIREVSNGR